MYGTGDVRKVDTKSMPLDFSLFKQIISPDFLDNFQNELDSFLSALQTEETEGNQGKKIFY